MGNLVNLVLRGSDLPFLAEEDEEGIVWLTAVNGLPLFWLSLLDAHDLGGEWEQGVRAYYADPDESYDGLPPLRVGWSSAQARLTRAEARVDQRLPTLAAMFREWAAALRGLARAGPTQEVRFDLNGFANFSASADELLGELRWRVDLWHGREVAMLATINDVGNDLTGLDDSTGSPFPRAMPEWEAGKRPREYDSPPRRAAGRWENILDWAMTLLCAATVLSGAIIGNWLYGTTGLWIGEATGAGAFALVTWRWLRRRERQRRHTPTLIDRAGP